MSDKILFHGPIDVEVKVYIINDDAESTGTATICLGKGKYPTQEKIMKAVATFEKNSLPEGFRLCNRVEFTNALLSECGSMEKFAFTGSKEWDDI